MKSLNQVFLIGNITRDPEEKSTQSGNALVTFGLAMNRVWYDKNDEKQEEVCFVDCVAWGKTGEALAKYHRKGDPIHISGRLQYRQWEDKDGKKRSGLEVIVEDFIIIKPFEEDGGGPRRSERGSERRRDDDRGGRSAPARRQRGDEDEGRDRNSGDDIEL